MRNDCIRRAIAYSLLPKALSLVQKKDLYIAVKVFEEGDDLLSHQVAVPSALMCLTSLFGMGRGEPHCPSHLNCHGCLLSLSK